MSLRRNLNGANINMNKITKKKLSIHIIFIFIFSLFCITNLYCNPAHGKFEKEEIAIFAGGCFWCMQKPFDDLKNKGVISTRVGYTGGAKDNPTYEETSSGTTGHREAIEVTFNPLKISFLELLNIFWKNVDPYDNKGQFCDKGEQYTSAVFYTGESQKKDFESSIKELEKRGIHKNKIATSILPSQKFFAAEEYHQMYYIKNPIRYKFYRSRCGRDQRLKEVWGTINTSHD